ncbi:MAG: glycosyltransferase family 4 protein [Candidatus Aenigmatarchaeota archaeon]
MKVLIPCSGYGRIYRGVESWVEYLSKEFVKNGLEVYILCGQETYLNRKNGVKILKFPILKRESLIYKQRPFEEISTLIESASLSISSFPYFLASKFDVILTPQWSDLYSNFILKWFKKIKTVFCFHSSPRKLTKILYLPISFNSVNEIIAVSEFVKTNIKKVFGVDSKVIYNGVDTHIFRPIKIEKDRKIVSLLYVGSLLRKKGIYTLIDVVKELDKEQLELLIVGHGPEEKNIRNLIKSNKIGNIKLLGKVSLQKLIKIYNYSDIVIIPSEYPEALPIVALEAMACGKPIIASNIGGLGEIIKKSKGGLLFEPINEKDLIEKILELANNNQKRKILGKNGRKFAKKELDWSKISEKYIKIMEN